ncbi:MAG: hypothetical protein ACKVQR_15060, partial [Aquabacterium sp.]
MIRSTHLIAAVATLLLAGPTAAQGPAVRSFDRVPTVDELRAALARPATATPARPAAVPADDAGPRPDGAPRARGL